MKLLNHSYLCHIYLNLTYITSFYDSSTFGLCFLLIEWWKNFYDVKKIQICEFIIYFIIVKYKIIIKTTYFYHWINWKKRIFFSISRFQNLFWLPSYFILSRETSLYIYFNIHVYTKWTQFSHWIHWLTLLSSLGRSSAKTRLVLGLAILSNIHFLNMISEIVVRFINDYISAIKI